VENRTNHDELGDVIDIYIYSNT